VIIYSFHQVSANQKVLVKYLAIIVPFRKGA
jgi:hypothetical protein